MVYSNCEAIFHLTHIKLPITKELLRERKREGDKVIKYLGTDVLNLPNKSMAKALHNKYNKNKFDIKIDGKYWWVIGDCTDRQFGYLMKHLYRNYGLLYAGVSSGAKK